MILKGGIKVSKVVDINTVYLEQVPYSLLPLSNLKMPPTQIEKQTGAARMHQTGLGRYHEDARN